MNNSQICLTEALFLLAHKPDGKRLIQRKYLKIGLAGALLTDLAEHRRISINAGKVVSENGSAALSGLLAEPDDLIRAETQPRTAKHWVRKFRSSNIERNVSSRLQERGLVQSQSDALLGIFPIVRHLPEPEILAQLGSLLTDVLRGQSQPTGWNASLISLCDATGLLRRILPAVSKAEVKAIVEGEWASEAVRKVIKQANSAVRMAIISTVNANNGSQGF
ncbi:GOLPH3/VPS74 family protein [Psychromicrobium lacuslunae]|uniref:GPP34 family phosphoprotein n=1 Tax=Psychromicrobium lacuslunae TaxID=1618207 RepID=A0A0D4BYC2_9MICC|nr:GPP34 family phosphoprotein [Psychromicrobium lacuslunae]AJT41462.1 hypothetical protein UM93_07915 [Psychromicrobium lacuslunae]